MNVCLLRSIANACKLEQTTPKLIKRTRLLKTYHGCCNSGLELQLPDQVLLCQKRPSFFTGNYRFFTLSFGPFRPGQHCPVIKIYRISLYFCQDNRIVVLQRQQLPLKIISLPLLKFSSRNAASVLRGVTRIAFSLRYRFISFLCGANDISF